MKKVITLSAFIVAGLTAFGQTFQWDTNDTIETNLALNTTAQYPTYQSAIGSDTVTLAIEVIYNDLPNTWDGMLCIYGVCLGTIPQVGVQATMDPIYGSLQGMVRLTVNPYNGTETAKLQVYVYDVNFPNDGDTATFLLNTTLGLDDVTAEPLIMAPNPATEAISIEVPASAEAVRVLDVNGKIMKETTVANAGNVSINVADLPAGVYTVQLATKEGIRSSRLVKQ